MALHDLVASARALPGDPATSGSSGASSAAPITPCAPNLSALAVARVGERGHHPFLTFYDDATGERTELSYATFDNWVAKTANLLVDELERERGDRVAVVLGDHWTTAVVAFACWKVGCCVVPVAAGSTADQARGVLEAAGATAGFVHEGLLADLGTLRQDTALEQLVVVGGGLGGRLGSGADLPADVVGYGEEVAAFGDEFDDPTVVLDDDALLVLPGQGGRAPAAVRLTQGNLLAAAEALGAWGLAADDRVLCAQTVLQADGLALGHLAPFAAGGSVVLTRNTDPARWWRRVADEKVSLLLGSPALLDRLPQEEPPDVLRGALVPSGAAPAAVARARDRLPVAVGHGVLEATHASTFGPLDPDEPTLAWLGDLRGRPVGAVTARAAVAALDGDGNPLPSGAEGRVAVRGPVVMAGYDRRPDLDEQVFASGWFATSERGYTDVGPDGRTHVFVTGPDGSQPPGSGR